MSDSDLSGDVKEALKELFATKRSLPKILTSSSLILAALYVLGFVFLKTYLAVFGFQIELSSLSIPNLLLAHRYFVGQHFFVVAGALECFLFMRLGASEFKRAWFSALVVFFAPFLLLVVAYSASAWSEPNTPIGFDPAARFIWLAMVSGWLTAALSYLAYRWVAKGAGLSFPRAAKLLVFIASLAAVVSSYRFYAYVAAADRLDHNKLQRLALIEPALDAPCGVVYVDTADFFLICGANERRVISRNDVKQYRVLTPEPPTIRHSTPNSSLQRTIPKRSPG